MQTWAVEKSDSNHGTDTNNSISSERFRKINYVKKEKTMTSLYITHNHITLTLTIKNRWKTADNKEEVANQRHDGRTAEKCTGSTKPLLEASLYALQCHGVTEYIKSLTFTIYLIYTRGLQTTACKESLSGPRQPGRCCV